MNTSHTGAALAVALGLIASGCDPSSVPALAPPVTPAVLVAEPVSRRISEWDEYTGRLASPETVEVRARVSGYIEKVHFKEGSEVQAGEVLFVLDPRPYRAIVDRLQADLGAARARVQLARNDVQRAQGLVKTEAMSTEEFETRVQLQAQMEESVHSAEAALRAAELDVEFTEVR
ncbi:MAG: efflux RND transporter periplasmic adaptor subunit, partial [Verrucomicrobia bacterium]|nr:efflux RND transporter periplasmic adaptor subunit [Verrucomicrobiota bacterium]